MDKFSFDAVIFDLDGVITQTAPIHSQAWKTMFDEFLLGMVNKKKESFEPFDLRDDYLNYPGIYIVGVYNKSETKIAGRLIENEDMINCPNWLHMIFKIEESDWIDLNKVKIISFKRRFWLLY